MASFEIFQNSLNIKRNLYEQPRLAVYHIKSDAHLEHCRILRGFCKNSSQLLGANNFRSKTVIDIEEGSKYTSVKRKQLSVTNRPFPNSILLNFLLFQLY